jgi:hypothetical protein
MKCWSYVSIHKGEMIASVYSMTTDASHNFDADPAVFVEAWKKQVARFPKFEHVIDDGPEVANANVVEGGRTQFGGRSFTGYDGKRLAVAVLELQVTSGSVHMSDGSITVYYAHRTPVMEPLFAAYDKRIEDAAKEKGAQKKSFEDKTTPR